MEAMILRINKELMKGNAAILILSLLDRADMYGYQIIQEIQAASDDVFDLKEGSLYPLLHGLESDAKISSYWVETIENRKRKYYRLTGGGKKMLADKRNEWAVYTETVNAVIEGATYEFPY
jgi:PadR family transcriptional regulator PadR